MHMYNNNLNFVLNS